VTPLRLCHWEVVNDDTFYTDKLGQFKKQFFNVEQLSIPGNSWISIELTIGVGDVVDGYAEPEPSTGYPLKLLVQTNGGARVITVDGFSRISADEEQALALKIEIERPLTCSNYVPGGSWHEGAHGFNPKWAVDPGPQSLPERQWTRLIAAGLEAGDQVTVYNTESNSLISTTTATRAGVVSADAVVKPGVQLRITHAIPSPPERKSRPTADRGPRTLLIQRRLTRFSTIECGEPVKAVAASLVHRAPMVLVALSGHQLVYELTDPNAPRLERIEREEGLSGLARIPQGWVAWGNFGLRVLDPIGRCYPVSLRDPFLRLDDGPVHAVALLGDGRLLLSRPQGHEVRNIRPSTKRPRAPRSADLASARPLQPWPGQIHSADPWLGSAARAGDLLVSSESTAAGVWSITATYLNGYRRGALAQIPERT
jgi:hypothetical protein